MTKEFRNLAAQGDILIRRIEALPAALAPVAVDDGVYILAHSETGHHHVIDSRAATLLIDETNRFISYLSVSEPCEIKHLRSFDTHESLAIDRGFYEIRRQREYTPEGLRRVED